MNAARLARRLQEANNDPTKMAEAIHDEVTDPSTGLVTRDHLDRRLVGTELRLREHMDTRFDALDERFVTRNFLNVSLAQFEARTMRIVVVGLILATAANISATFLR
jgi:phospholipid N-methyltransferase